MLTADEIPWSQPPIGPSLSARVILADTSREYVWALAQEALTWREMTLAALDRLAAAEALAWEHQQRSVELQRQVAQLLGRR